MSYVHPSAPHRHHILPARAEPPQPRPSNTSPNQKRNIKPTVSNPGAYSASPSQLSLASDLPSAALGHPYQPAYGYAPHDPTAAFTFPQHSHYRGPIQTQGLPHPPPPPPPQQQQQQQPAVLSPLGSRKRRASDLELPGGAPTGNAGGYAAHPHGLGPTGAEVDVGGLVPGPTPQLPSPVAKKGRTNTPWTPAEEQRLKALREAGSSWSEIAKTFPQRTEGSVKKHWYKDMHYADFAEDEVSNFVRLTREPDARGYVALTLEQSAALLQAIKDYENNKWKVIGQKVGKPAKACEQFAKEQGWKV